MKKGEGVASCYQRQLEALNQLSRAILSNVDLEKIEKLLLKEIQAIFGGVGCVLYVADGNGYLVPKTPTRIRGEDLSKIKIKIGQGVSGRAWTRQVPIYSNDVLRHKDFRRGIHPTTLKLNISKILSVPLLLDGQPVALLSVARSHRQPDFTDLDEELLASFGNQAAIAIKNASTYQTLKREQEALQESAERYRRVFEDSPMGLYRTTPDGRILMVNPALLKMLGYSSLDELSKRNLEDSGYEPGYPRSGFKKRIESKGEVVGLESAWIRADGSTSYVRESARAIRDGDGNTLYYEGSVEDITASKLLSEISETVTGSLDLEEVLRSVMRETCKALGFQMAAVYLHNPTERRLELRSTYNTPKATAEKLKEVTFQVQKSLTGQCFKSGKVISYDKLNAAQRRKAHKLFYHQRLKALTCIPVTAKDKKIGVLSLVSRKEVKLDPILERMASAIGNQVGMAIENASVHQALKREQQALEKGNRELLEKGKELRQSYTELKLLNEISGVVSGSLNLDKVLRSIMRETCKVLGFETAGIFFHNPKEEVLECISTFNLRKAGISSFKGVLLPVDGSLAGWSFQRGCVIAHDKLSPEERKRAHDILDRLKVKSFVLIPVTSTGEKVGVLILTTRKDVKLSPSQESLASAIGNQVGIAIENARLYRKTSEQTRKLADWNKRLSAFLSVSEAAVESADLESFLAQIVKLVVESFKADGCAVALLDETRNFAVVKAFHTKRVKPFPVIGERIELAKFPNLSAVCLQGEIRFLNPETFKEASPSKHEYTTKSKMKSGMFTPLECEKENLGALCLYHAEVNRRYRQEEVDFLVAIGNQVATAIKKYKLAQEVEEKKRNLVRLSSEIIQLQEKERKAVAGELHDSVGQSLTAMRINLDFAKNSLPPGRKELKSRIRQTSRLVADTMEEIRSIGQKLRPTMLDDLGLIPTLRSFIKDFSQQLSIPVHFRSQGDTERLTPDVKITIYRIVQEGLNNIAKHSKATEAWISLQIKGSVCSLEIKDDGIGIDAEKVLKSTDTRRGFGVFNIRERASLLGGKLEIQSDKGKGTTLLVTIPIPEGEGDEQSQSSISR
jgi:PAS domain S-box-containing protein